MSNHKALQGRTPLFKTMFGSRLYGTNTPTSDIDWKELFLPNLENLLIGKKPTNVVVSTGGDKLRNTKDDVDQEFIPIQVFANDFIGGQTYAVELAFAILSSDFKAGQEFLSEHVTGKKDLILFTRELVESFLTSNIKAMIGYAMNQAQVYGIKGSRLASVRNFHDYLAGILSISGVLLDGKPLSESKLETCVEWVNDHTDKYMFMTTYEHMDQTLPAISILEKLYPVNITVGEAFDRVKKLISKYGTRAEDAENAKGVDWKATSHAVRITMQAIRILSNGFLVFPLPKKEIDLLLSIKHGELPFAEVEAILVNLFAELDQIKETTVLPRRTAEMDEYFEVWLKGWMRYFYKCFN